VRGKAPGSATGRGLSLKGRAIALLARRDYSAVELRRKLAPHAESEEELESLLDGLRRDGYLSDARFAASLVRRRAERYGTARIAQELKTHQLPETVLAGELAGLKDSEEARCLQAWAKRFGVPPQNLQERAKQSRFLQARGFSSAAIRAALKGGPAVDED
jgi:regulatory protein